MTAGRPLFCTTAPGGCWELCAVVITTRYQLSNLHANVCQSGVCTTQHGCYGNVRFHALSRNPTIFTEILRRGEVDGDITGSREIQMRTNEYGSLFTEYYGFCLVTSHDSWGNLEMVPCVCVFVWVCWTDMTSEWHQAMMALINHNPSLNHNDDHQKLSKGLGLKKLSLLMVNVLKPVLEVLWVPYTQYS